MRPSQWVDRVSRSYPLKLAVSFALLLVLITAAGVGLYAQTDSILYNDTRTDLDSAARIEAQSLDEWVEEKQLLTKSIAEGAPLYATADGEPVQYLWRVVERDGDVRAAFFVDTKNESVITSVGSARIVSSSAVSRTAGQRAFVRRPDGDSVFVSEPFRAYEGGAPVILLSASVPDREHRAVVTVVNLQRLSTSEAHQFDEAQFQVVDADGVVIMSNNEREILDRTGFDAVPHGNTSATETRNAGEQAIVGAASMKSREWTVLAWMPTAQAFAIRSTVTEGLALMLGTVLLGFGVMGYVLTRNTVSPLRELTTKAQQLQNGSLDEPIRTDRTDEFGELFAAFDEMRTSLRGRIQEVERAHEESETLRRQLQTETAVFAETMSACAEGELDRRLDPSIDQPSMRTIAEAFNDMMDDVEQQTEELEAFTSIVSHDLRNPLNVASGWVQVVAEESDSEHVPRVLDALDRMEQIIEDGLTLARGTDPNRIESVDIPTRAQAAWAHVDQHEATLSIDDSGSIDADPNLLEQLFENLFRNAIEHAGDDVDISVESLQNGFVVGDDGPGLPDDRIDELFEPGVSDGSGGTGLGLTIVKRIAAAHGWSVDARNGPNGARFEFRVRSAADSPADAGSEVALNG